MLPVIETELHNLLGLRSIELLIDLEDQLPHLLEVAQSINAVLQSNALGHKGFHAQIHDHDFLVIKWRLKGILRHQNGADIAQALHIVGHVQL